MGRRVGSKNELIKCPYCGEMYSVTYKSCPFCNGDGTGRWDEPEEDYEDDAPAKGGKRLASGGGSVGGGRKPPSVRRIISTVVSLALMIAAAGIVISIVRSFLGGKKQPDPQPTPSAAVSVQPSAAPSAPASVDPAVSQDPAVPSAEPSAPAVVSQPPAPQVSTPSVDMIAPTDFKLNREDFTLDHVGETFTMMATYTPSNARGDITWKSSDPNVASVSWNGVVTAVSKGTVTVTATVAGVGEKKCIVRCNFTNTATTTTTTTTTAPAASSAPSSSGLKLSREDFTLSFAGDSWRLVVSGTSSAVTWSSSNSEVAKVSSDGTVTAVSKGTCTVSATVDGQTLKCIVRCSF